MPVPWEAIRNYVETAVQITGEVERTDLLFLAESDGYADDIVDALDAIGSRIFRGPEAVAQTKRFLLQGGFIVEG
jgi:hypothetical protein